MKDTPESFDSHFPHFFSKYTTMKSGCLGKLSHIRKSDWLLGSFWSWSDRFCPLSVNPVVSS